MLGEINDDDFESNNSDLDGIETSTNKLSFEDNGSNNVSIKSEILTHNETNIAYDISTKDDDIDDENENPTERTDDVVDEDKILVVTSMTLEESEDILEDTNADSDNVIVVTSAPVA